MSGKTLNISIFLIIMFLVIISMIGMNDKGYSMIKHAPINWSQAYQENGSIYIPGSLETESGKFSLGWKV
jgi:hypothetical protein